MLEPIMPSSSRVWIAVTVISLALWIFVLRRVHRAQRASPFRRD